MRLAVLVVLTVLLPFSAAVAADGSHKKAKAHKRSTPASVASAPRPDRYHELMADKMPIGTLDWWEQMRREGRLGGETP